MSPLSISSKLEEYSSQLQDQRTTRSLHLAAQMLKCLAALLESQWVVVNALPPLSSHPTSQGQFDHEGEKRSKTCTPKPEARQLGAPG